MNLHENFLQLPSYQRLKELASHPLDLSEPGILTPERIKKFTAESAGFKFLFATEQVTDDVVEALVYLSEEAHVITQMQKMQSGEVMNFIEGYPSENRPVLHTALRDFFDNPQTSKTASQARDMAKVEVDKIRAFEKEMAPFDNLVVIGIGGSELGPKANFLALRNHIKSNRDVFFIGNVDPDDADTILKNLDLAKTLVLVVSKSGTTEETVTNEALVRTRFKQAGLEPKQHFIAVTGEGSAMDDSPTYKAVFYMWDWVGGRFSATSASGGLIFTFAYGFEIYWEFLRGANLMDQAALQEDITANIPLLGALIAVWNRNFLNHPTLAIIPYSAGLSRLSAHVQQVEMESNGKRIDRQGEPVTFSTSPIFWGEPGNNAQHSFFQMLHQGTDIVPIEFIGFKECQSKNDLEQQGVTSQEKLLSNLFAQMLALSLGQKNDNPNKVFPGKRPSHLLLAKELTPATLGALFAYYEHKVAFQGFIWNINSFDQEGVQLGKVLANRFVDLFRARRGEKVKTEANPLESALLSQLDSI